MELNEEILASRKLLNEIADLCEHSTLTGALSGGNGRAAQRYNALLSRLLAIGAVPNGLFSEIPEDSPYAETGVEARMLSSYVKRNGDEGGKADKGILLRLAPFMDSSDLSSLVREQIREGVHMDLEGLSQLAPFLDGKMLGEMIREQMGGPPRPDKPAPPAGPAQAANPAPPASSATPTRGIVPTDSRADSIGTLVDLLKNPHLSNEERDGLLERLRAAAT